MRGVERAIYARHFAGCCMHVVCDDGNTGDFAVEVCRKDAAKAKHDDCAKLGAFLSTLTRVQRRSYLRSRPQRAR
jgi:hypothetical protein